MHRVIVSLASNRFQKKNLSKARQRLGEVIFNLQFSAELWTEPLSSKRSDKYLNQLAIGNTKLSESELCEWLKATELSFGRTDAKRRLGIVPIDLDLLLYDNHRSHLPDWERPYVRLLIGEL